MNYVQRIVVVVIVNAVSVTIVVDFVVIFPLLAPVFNSLASRGLGLVI